MSNNVNRIRITNFQFRFVFVLLALISGVVVNTCGYIRQEGYESFVHIAKEFDGKHSILFLFVVKTRFRILVDIVVVLDSEFLAKKLTDNLPSVKVITLPKSGGVSCCF